MPLALVVVSERVTPVAAAEVQALEADLGTRLPDGYAELVTTYGAGTVCDEFNVLDPVRVRRRLPESRARWAEYWFWDEAVVTQSQLATGVPVADSANGDQLVWVARRLVLLPRHEDRAADFGTSYNAAVRRFCTSGEFVHPSSVLWFQSWSVDSWYQNWSGGSFDAVVEAVRGLGLHVAEDSSPAGGSTTFLLPAIAGHVHVAEIDDDPPLYVHLRYGVGKDADVAGVIRTLEAAGVEPGGRWGGPQSRPGS